MTESFDALPSKLADMTPGQRLYFFEVLAHNLTVTARTVWADDDLTSREQVCSLKTLNECLHRAIARISVERLKTREWSDESFCGLLSETDNELHPTLRGSVLWAAWHSYSTAIKAA